MNALAESVAEELGATARTFNHVKGCLLWYAEHRLHREGIPSIVIGEEGRIPRSPTQIAATQATYAKIASCMKERDPADYDFDPPITPGRITDLLIFYQSDEPAYDMATRRGVTWPAFVRECRRTRNVLRRRFVEALLVDE